MYMQSFVTQYILNGFKILAVLSETAMLHTKLNCKASAQEKQIINKKIISTT